MDKTPSRKGLIKKRLSPRRYFQDMAEFGLLDDFLSNSLMEDFEEDEIFRNDMLEVLYHYSKSPSPLLEKFYLEKLCESLSYFLEYTRPCRKPKL